MDEFDNTIVVDPEEFYSSDPTTYEEQLLETISNNTFDTTIKINTLNDNLKSFGFLTCLFLCTIFLYLFFHYTTNRRDI